MSFFLILLTNLINYLQVCQRGPHRPTTADEGHDSHGKGFQVSRLLSNLGNPGTLYPYPVKPGPGIKGSGFKRVRVRVRKIYPGVTRDTYYSCAIQTPPPTNSAQVKPTLSSHQLSTIVYGRFPSTPTPIFADRYDI